MASLTSIHLMLLLLVWTMTTLSIGLPTGGNRLMEIDMNHDLIPQDDMTQKVKEVLHSQHAIMGIFGNVFERLGGEQFLYEWAEDNPTKFIMLMTKMVPTLTPTTGLQGDVNVIVHPSLQPSDLDGSEDA